MALFGCLQGFLFRLVGKPHGASAKPPAPSKRTAPNHMAKARVLSETADRAATHLYYHSSSPTDQDKGVCPMSMASGSRRRRERAYEQPNERPRATHLGTLVSALASAMGRVAQKGRVFGGALAPSQIATLETAPGQSMNILLLRLAVLAWLAGLLVAQQPAVPLSSSNRWIVDQNGQRVKFRCINWAGHLEANVPEGLHKQPITYVANWIKNNGFNCVRLTYSIDMALNPDLLISDSFQAAAVATNTSPDAMNDIYEQIAVTNPDLANGTTSDAFGAVVDALWDVGVMTIIDNHVSKASWCCNLTDGNGWWSDAPGYNAANSRYFDTTNWMQGLLAMAEWAKCHTGVVAMSLRNELRANDLQFVDASDAWLDHIPAAATAVHQNNSDVLIILGGLNGATDFTFMRDSPVDTSAWAGKNVWEAHDYSFTPLTPNLGWCFLNEQVFGTLWGFVLEENEAFTGPLFLSEFGVGMTGGPDNGLSDADNTYLTCLVSYMEGNDADWSLWAVQGSYYVRDYILDYDESYGALDHDWVDWRNPAFPGMLGSMWQQSQGP